MSILIQQEKCKGCGICVKSCIFSAIDMINNIAAINENCTGCGVCIDKCPFEAIEKSSVEKALDFTDYNGIWVIAEQRLGKLADVSIELLGKGLELKEKLETNLCAVICGENIDDIVGELFAYGADKVYFADRPYLKNYTTAPYVKTIGNAVNKYKPEIILLGATNIGRDLAPCLAAFCETGLTADCTSLEIDNADGKLLQTRPAFGGNLMATITCPNHRPQMSTVRPDVYDKAIYDGKRLENQKDNMIEMTTEIEESDLSVQVINVVESIKSEVSLSDADIIVAGGKGVGSKEGFDFLFELADSIGGAVAASRACVDEGWIDHSHQVGQTGVTVKPKLYLAFGISGAVQHLAGMQNSGCIVAVNTNKDAPIFDVADYGIVADLHTVIPMIMKYWKK